MKKIFLLALILLGGIFLIKKKEGVWEERKKDQCQVINCHGLEVECGFGKKMACTLEYAAGDVCRQYVDCQVVEGECRPKEKEEYHHCATCVKNCWESFSSDDPGVIDCEARCGSR